MQSRNALPTITPANPSPRNHKPLPGPQYKHPTRQDIETKFGLSVPDQRAVEHALHAWHYAASDSEDATKTMARDAAAVVALVASEKHDLEVLWAAGVLMGIRCRGAVSLVSNTAEDGSSASALHASVLDDAELSQSGLPASSKSSEGTVDGSMSPRRSGAECEKGCQEGCTQSNRKKGQTAVEEQEKSGREVNIANNAKRCRGNWKICSGAVSYAK